MCSLTKHGKVFVLEFLGAGDHRLTHSLMKEIVEHLEEVNNSAEAGALVTANREGKFYSNGLDLEWMQQNPVERGPVTYKKFEELLLAILNVNVPTIACVNGHAAGGGFPLAMAHDHRYMRGDRGFLYSSAVDIGIAIPAGTLAVIRSKASPRVFKDALLKCVKYTGKMALEGELVDAVFDDPVTNFQQAMKAAQSLADKNFDKTVYRTVRRAMYPQLFEQLQAGESDLFVPVQKIT